MVAKVLITSVLTAVSALAGPGGDPFAGSSSCIACHRALAGREAQPVDLWQGSVHRTSGMGCHSCHGGDPASLEAAKGPGTGYVGVPEADKVAAICGSCHSDPVAMGPFGLPIGQEAAFRAGSHGRGGMEGGGTPTCADCHGAHGILPATEPRSAVHPRRMVGLCLGCHRTGEPGRTGDGPELYPGSAHGRALMEDGNRMAPSCASCHGAHGTSGVTPADTPKVCGRCHRPVTDHFRSGPHLRALEITGQPGCTACHTAHGREEGTGPTCDSCHRATEPALAIEQGISQDLAAARLLLMEARARASSLVLRGMDTAAIEMKLKEAASWLVMGGSAFHSLDVGTVAEMTGMAREKIGAAGDIADRLEVEMGIRRAGLWFLSLLAATVVLLLGVKLRLIERRDRSGRFMDDQVRPDRKEGNR